MKLIHCSDLHLDSKMETNLTKEKAKERNTEVFLSFKRLISYAKENDVKAILIAGDMFDEKRVSKNMIDMVFSEIKKASDIEFFYLQGNHDGAFKEIEACENLRLFNDKWTYYDCGNVRIAGVELTKDNCFSIYEQLKLNKEDTNIVMLHGQEAASAGEEQVCLNLLREKNIDYLALGHIHSYKCEALDMNGKYAYCGCLEGRGFDECGEKGFVLLDVQEKEVKVSFIPFSHRVLHEIEMDITGFCTINEMISEAEKLLDAIDPKDLVKLVLTGTYTAEVNKDIEFMHKALADRVYFLKIKDKSSLLINAGDYKYDKTLKGEFIRTVLAGDKSDDDKEKIIACGLAALKGEKISL